jgi:hypothetical protein
LILRVGLLSYLLTYLLEERRRRATTKKLINKTNTLYNSS